MDLLFTAIELPSCVSTHTHTHTRLQRELLISNVSFYFLDTLHGHQLGFHDVTHH